jgi:hypothetical protein
MQKIAFFKDDNSKAPYRVVNEYSGLGGRMFSVCEPLRESGNYLIAMTEELDLFTLGEIDELLNTWERDNSVCCDKFELAATPMRNKDDSFHFWTYCKNCGKFNKRYEP